MFCYIHYVILPSLSLIYFSYLYLFSIQAILVFPSLSVSLLFPLFFASIQAPPFSFPSSVFLPPVPLPQSVSMHLFSILAPFFPPQSVSFFFHVSVLCTCALCISSSICLSSFHVLVLILAPRASSVSRPPSLTHSSECDRQVLVTVEASSRARLLFGSAVPDLQPACPTFK